MVDAVREEPVRVLALKELTAIVPLVRLLVVVVLALRELTERVLARRVLVVMVDPLIPFVEILLDHMGALLVLVICMYPGGIGSEATVAILF
jgi:hypothetical protein